MTKLTLPSYEVTSSNMVGSIGCRPEASHTVNLIHDPVARLSKSRGFPITGGVLRIIPSSTHYFVFASEPPRELKRGGLRRAQTVIRPVQVRRTSPPGLEPCRSPDFETCIVAGEEYHQQWRWHTCVLELLPRGRYWMGNLAVAELSMLYNGDIARARRPDLATGWALYTKT